MKWHVLRNNNKTNQNLDEISKRTCNIIIFYLNLYSNTGYHSFEKNQPRVFISELNKFIDNRNSINFDSKINITWI